MSGLAVNGELIISQGNKPIVVDFSVTDEAIEELRTELAGTDATIDYESARMAITKCRKLRTSVEAKRKEVVAPLLQWQRTINAEAKRIIGEIASIEDPIKDTKDAVDKAEEIRKAEEKRQAELAEQRRREEEEQRLRDERAKLEADKRELEEARKEIERLKASVKPETAPEAEPEPEPIQPEAAKPDPEPDADWEEDFAVIESWVEVCLSACPAEPMTNESALKLKHNIKSCLERFLDISVTGPFIAGQTF